MENASAASRILKTEFTQMLGIEYPIVVAPMFLVSNVDMVVAASEAGAIGTFPALNYRPLDEYKKALLEIRRRTSRPFGVNIIVNQSNQRQNEDLKWALDCGVNLLITSLGNPKTVIREAHQGGAKVFCDVTNLSHALKAQDLGADGVIAVCSGAGGHAGPISPLVLIPWLKEKLKIPVLLAGGVAEGRALAASLVLGADGVSVGTRFIASKEAQVDAAYKQAILAASPEDIVLSTRISGTPASVINTDYVKKIGLELPWLMKKFKSHPLTKKWSVPLIHWLGMKQLEKAALNPTWKSVWSAGQSVGLIHDILPCKEIIATMIEQAHKAMGDSQ